MTVQAGVGNAWPASCVVAKHVNAIAKHIVWHANDFPCVSLNSVINK